MLQKKVEISKSTKTPEQALASLMRQCARMERCSGDALRLMRGWQIEPNKAQEILQQLIKDRFIDDRRYAEAFVREKVSLSAWGEYKIKATLKRKGISEEIIREVLESSGNLHDTARLKERLDRKLRTVKYKNLYDLRTKLIRYGLSLGFSMDDAIKTVEDITKNHPTEPECEENFF